MTKLPSGSWRLRVEGPARNGRRSYVTRTHRGDKRSAEQALARLLVEVGQGQHVGEDATVTDTVEAWLAQAQIEVTTRRDYRSVIDRHITPHVGSMKVHQLRASHLDRLYRQLSDSGLGPARVRRVHNVIARALSQAVRWGWIARNPARDASPPEVRRAEVVAPTVDHMRSLLGAADGELLTWLRLDASLGARRGEVSALRWSDVDLADRVVTIPEALVDGGPGIGVVRKTTKTRNVRRIALDDGTAKVLTAHRRMVAERALAAGIPLTDDGYLFSYDAAGVTPWRPDKVTRDFAELRQRLGIPAQIKLRSLRHFVATQMLAAGVDPRTVAGRLGHSKPSTTLDIYAAFLPARDREAAELLGELLG